MKTREDARSFLITALEAGGAVADATKEFDLEAILDDIWKMSPEPMDWDLEKVDTEVFWGLIWKYSR